VAATVMAGVGITVAADMAAAVVDMPVVVVMPAAAVVDMPVVAAADMPMAAVDTAGVGADSRLLPSFFFCPFIPTGLEGQVCFCVSCNRRENTRHA